MHNELGLDQQSIKSEPTLTKNIQVWKKDGVNHDDLLTDLFTCIVHTWNRYKGKKCYTLPEAMSDAYQGILKAIEKDKLAPTIANKIIKCPECNNNNHMPDKMPYDDECNEYYENCEYGKTPKYRDFDLICEHCSHSWSHRVYKTVFSTHVFPYIRSSIQRGCRLAHDKNAVSIDNNKGEDEGSLLDILTLEEEINEEIPDNILNLIYDAIYNLSIKQQIAVAMRHGIGGICEYKINKDIKCKYCNENVETTIDYSISTNYVICQSCHVENKIDMRINQTEIAQHMNVTKQRICNILNNAHNKMRECIKPLMQNHGLMC